jgi:DUF1365 family protein
VTAVRPAGPATAARLYECRISHARTVPLRNTFTYRTYMWLVDLDRLPRPRTLMPLARFSARDHLGDPRRGIRENLDRFLADPWSTAVVTARIRWQGTKLYLRGLRPVPRPVHQPQEGVQ